jgi:hypothetical protein
MAIMDRKPRPAPVSDPNWTSLWALTGQRHAPQPAHVEGLDPVEARTAPGDNAGKMRERHVRGGSTMIGCIGLAIASAVPFIQPVLGAGSAASIPDLSGLWARQYIGFEPPLSGPGPVVNSSRVNGQSNLREFVGDHTNPILKPHAAATVKRHGEIELSGTAAPNPSNQCLPMSPPYILQRQQIQLLHQHNQVTILYAEGHQVRRVRLNAAHPPQLAPSWYGDSVGHFEGDTLVIDTVGIKVGPHSMIDSYGTPYSEALHVVERYRLIDYSEGQAAAQRSERENRRLFADSLTGNGVGIDAEYTGKALQVRFTVEDQNVFTMPWSATTTYWRASGNWVERSCAENVNVFYAGQNSALPIAKAADF